MCGARGDVGKTGRKMPGAQQRHKNKKLEGKKSFWLWWNEKRLCEAKHRKSWTKVSLKKKKKWSFWKQNRTWTKDEGKEERQSGGRVRRLLLGVTSLV